jgi:hypothetical protein
VSWQTVVKAEGPRQGRGSVLGRDTARRTRWWVLGLACGHTTERTVRYGPPADGRARQRGGTQYRSGEDVLPAPKKVLCRDGDCK